MVNEKAFHEVLSALDRVWHAGSTLQPTLKNRVEELDKTDWQRLAVLTRANRLHQCLIDAHDYLNDAQRPCTDRFRWAWELLPSRMIGVEIGETTVSMAAALIKVDLTQLETLIEKMKKRPPGSREEKAVDALIERYRHPHTAKECWVYFVEAVRIGAELFPLLQWQLLAGTTPMGDSPTHTGAEAVPGTTPTDVALPFTAVVLDAMCPGHARLLVPSKLLKAITLWRELHESRHSRSLNAAKFKRKPRSDLAWEAIADAIPLSQKVHDATAMQRQWRSRKDRFSLDQVNLGALLDEKLRRVGAVGLKFEPQTAAEAHWVALVVDAVRSAIPVRQVRVRSSRSKQITPPSMPPAFLSYIDAIFPQESRLRRGPKPIPARDLAAWVVYKFDRNIGWKSLPDGSTIHRHVQEWKRSGKLRILLQRAVDLGLVDRMRVGWML